MHADHANSSFRSANLSRRRFLRGVGACLALPALESFAPRVARAAIEPNRLAFSSTGAPLRMAFVYFPNGARQDYWWPTGDGSDFQFGRTMQPLEKLRQHVQVFRGLDNHNAEAGADGAGDHARANGTFLTGVRVRKTAGADIHAGVSIDQVAAGKMGYLTRFPSLELSCDAARKAGSCDSGYSCAYQYNLAWQSPTAPLAPESNPRLVFERLFGAGAQGQRAANYQFRQRQQRSILDFVLEDARSLERQLGGRDQQKLDEYLTSVRAIEARIQRAEAEQGKTPDPDMETPVGIPASFEEHIQLMYAMMLLAFQNDSTRIATLLLAHDGSNRTFPEIGITAGHHDSTHHKGNKEMLDRVGEIDLFYMRQFASFLEKLEETKDERGESLLHNSMILYGCGNADGNRHSHDNLPLVLAGGGGATLSPGQYRQFKSQPLANLFVSMLDRLGIEGVQTFGDSTDRIENI